MRYLLFFLMAFIGNVYANNLPGQQCSQHHCVAVIDAGSTGTRIHIYTYDLGNNNTVIKISDIWSKKIKPGFASLESNPQTLNSYLNILFSEVPESNIPVYFYATAGMRLLSQSKQQQYYQVLRHWFAEQSQWQLIDTRTITGNEEGLFAWLAVNYQLDTLSNPGKKLVGVMDMGGASVQVMFPIQNIARINPNNLVEFDMYGRHLTLFVHSFLGLGQTVLSHQFLDASHCFARNYQLPSGTAAEGNAFSCKQDVSKLINTVHGVDKIVKPILLENPVDSWYAIGGLPSLAIEKPFHFEGNQLTNQSLLQQSDTEVCQRQWSDLETRYPQNDLIYAYCLFSAYYYALMVDGYGLGVNKSINFFSNTQNTDWTLGVVLHHHQTQV